ncbi:pre-RNA processing PIH1/Nop17-domain-containing protein [Earliella scabrosa]|nr:pre-RNA processing PIH1/Nop17-domain-containing protein [Earliella scabrosa]
MSATTTRVSLAPSPGFCVKSVAQNSVACPVSSPSDDASAAAASPTNISIPSGLKIFVNIAWDTNVPPPPDGSDEAIERAMSDNAELDPHKAVQWFVPVIVFDPRLDTDKAGKPSAVFDCVFNSSLKSRSLRSPEFKTYLIELAFQRIEAQYGLLLSRQIGTPNIASKGKLKPRSVLVPTSLHKPAHSESTSPAAQSRKPLIEELPANTKAPAPPKGILKKNQPSTAPTSPSSAPPSPSPSARVPELSWSRTDDGRLRIALSVPHLTRDGIASTTLDLEPRRLIFTSPLSYCLDLDLSRPDTEIQKSLSARAGSEKSVQHALTLKREREFDVDGARAEWRIAEGQLVIYA